MTPLTYWLGWLLVAAGSLVALYWVLRLARRHERRRERRHW